MTRHSDNEFGDAAETGWADAPAPSASGALIFPCSASQNRFWFINSLNPGNPALNVALRWEVTGRLSPALAEQAFQAIIDRHEILRTRFIERDGEAMQEVLEHLNFKLSVIDLSMLPEAERLKEALAHGMREARKSFVLSVAPPIRATFLRLSSEHAVLLVTVHHVAFDGWSISILANEFGVIAEALNANRPYVLPELPLQYGDYCLWQKEYLASSGFEGETAYWKNKLGGAPYFEIAPDHERPAAPSYKGEILAAILPPELSDKLEDAARQRNVTLFAFGCAAMAATLRIYSGQDDVVFGTQIAGRDDPDLEDMIGLFINNLVMRFDASGDPTFDELLARANKTVQDALINQRMPFDRLVEVLNPPRDPKRTPLFSINFTVLRDVMDHKRYGEFVLHGQPSLSAGAFYDLFFFLVHWPSGWRMAMEYNPDLFEKHTAEGLLNFLMSVLEFAVLRPDAKVSSLTPPVRDLAVTSAPRKDLDAIEAALRENPDVRDALAAPASGYSEQGRPYAFVTPAANCRMPLEALPEKLSAYLDDVLPKGMARPGISVLLALPRNASGGIDYQALPPPAVTFATPLPAQVAANQTDIELKLATIWRDLLKVSDVGPTSNFFELGGHSLLAVRLMARIASEFGVKIDTVRLFQTPILREFAAQLAESQSATQAPRHLKVQPKGDRTPIIAIDDPVIAPGVLYFDLAKQIGTDRPVFCLPMIESSGGDPGRARTLEEIAADYVRQIREAQVHGPYILCGLCLAGVLAYECAQQLRKAGESVPLLILADVWAPGYFAALPWPKRLIYHLNYRIVLFRDRVNLLRRGKISLLEFLSQFRPIRKSGVLKLAARLGRIDEYVLIRQDIEDENWVRLRPLLTARNAYKVQPTTSDVIEFRSDEIVTTFVSPDMGWTDLVKGRFFVHKVSGKHLEMFRDEGARAMAEYLKPRLEEVDALRHGALPRQDATA
jgi:thioesterase domain-containing protein/acyl carrier protein